MKLSVDFGRWATTKAALAVAGALAIAGAVGSAVAISPTVSPPIKWAGGAPALFVTSGNGYSNLFQVPAGQSFMLTDLIVSNETNTSSNVTVQASLQDSCASVIQYKLMQVFVPANGNLILPLVTGLGFSAGQRVCIVTSNGTPMQVNMRGFLFTPAPAS